jgi:hypothetical protein
MKNELLAYAVVFILAAGIITGIWHGIEYTPEPAQATIPAEYRRTYREAKERYQEWMAYPSWTRQDEIRDWCYEEFSVPLPVVRRVDPLLEMWIAGVRQDYMFARQIWEVDELRRGE